LLDKGDASVEGCLLLKVKGTSKIWVETKEFINCSGTGRDNPCLEVDFIALGMGKAVLTTVFVRHVNAAGE
jgi:hypothetical protein